MNKQKKGIAIEGPVLRQKEREPTKVPVTQPRKAQRCSTTMKERSPKQDGRGSTREPKLKEVADQQKAVTFASTLGLKKSLAGKDPKTRSVKGSSGWKTNPHRTT